MEEQWSQLFKPGTKVKVKIKGSHGVILKTHFIAKYASSYVYCYATAKADVSIIGESKTMEVQLRDLILM